MMMGMCSDENSQLRTMLIIKTHPSVMCMFKLSKKLRPTNIPKTMEYLKLTTMKSLTLESLNNNQTQECKFTNAKKVFNPRTKKLFSSC
jgi:hypothetical protein